MTAAAINAAPTITAGITAANTGAALATAAATAVPLMQAAGTGLSVVGAVQQGKAAQANSEFQAKQLEIKGQEERAAAQQEAIRLGRNKKLALSRAQSLAAASGFDPSDPSTSANRADIEEYGTLQQQMAMYGGNARYSGYMAQADAARMSGLDKKKAGIYSGFSTAVDGVSSMAKYR